MLILARIVGFVYALSPGKDCLIYHDKLHQYAGIMMAFGTSGLTFGHAENQICTGQQSIRLDRMLALLDGLKLAQNIGVLPEAIARH